MMKKKQFHILLGILIGLLNLFLLLHNLLLMVVFDLLIVISFIPLAFFHKKYNMFYISTIICIAITTILAFIIDFSRHPLGMP